MFTISQVTEAHSKVKSGADFPKYVQEPKKLGVEAYEHYVSDGHIHYLDKNNFEVTAGAKYPSMDIAEKGSKEKLEQALAIHQQGKTGYPAFCRQAAAAGIEKWTVHLVKMTCTYYDKNVSGVMAEEIPAA